MYSCWSGLLALQTAAHHTPSRKAKPHAPGFGRGAAAGAAQRPSVLLHHTPSRKTKLHAPGFGRGAAGVTHTLSVAVAGNPLRCHVISFEFDARQGDGRQCVHHTHVQKTDALQLKGHKLLWLLLCEGADAHLGTVCLMAGGAPTEHQKSSGGGGAEQLGATHGWQPEKAGHGAWLAACGSCTCSNSLTSQAALLTEVKTLGSG